MTHLHKEIAVQLRWRNRQRRLRRSGNCSFRDFLNGELRQIDHLVNRGETGPATKYNAWLAFFCLICIQAKRMMVAINRCSEED